MPRNTRTISALPPETARKLSQLGIRIRVARQRRDLTLRELASQMMTAVNTLRRVEAGDPAASMAAYASALWALGLDDGLEKLARLDEGRFAGAAQKQRVRHPKKERDDAF